MYGTIARARPKPGQEQAVVAMLEEWARSRASKIRGPVASYLLRPEAKSGELLMVAVFQDLKTYRDNADDPEQDRWFRRLRELLQSDPVWEDGEYLFAQTY